MLKYILIISLLFFAGCSSNISILDLEEVTNNDTGAIQTEDILLRIASGEIQGFSVVHKFGGSQLTTTMKPVTQSGFYRTPTVAKQLEVVSDSAQDTHTTGTGGWSVYITGLNSSWEEESVEVNLNGLTAVTIPVNFTRVYRWYVTSSGTYANQTSGSHTGNLEIREVGGGATWSIIPNTPFPQGQSEIGVYSIPAGKTAYLIEKNIFVDTTKTADLYFFQRCNINDTSAPYTGTIRLIEREVGVQGGYSLALKIPKGPYVGPCDLGFMGAVNVGTAESSVEFELVLLNN